MSSERQQLEHARELILNRQFDEARAILSQMSGHPIADQWLAKLDDLAPPVVHPQAPAPTARSMSAPAPLTLTVNPTTTRYGVAGFVALMALLMIVGFFVFPWMDLGEIDLFGFSLGALADDEDQGLLRITAMELWSGENSGEKFTLNMEHPEGGFRHVRLLDRFLILTPIGALGLLWLAWRYATDAAVSRPLLIMLIFLAFLLYAWPGTWEDLSNRALKNALRDSIDAEAPAGMDLGFSMLGESMVEGMYSQTYSTGEQETLGILAVLAGIVGLIVEFLPQLQAAQRRIANSS